MGRLDLFSDITDSMNPLEVNSSNIMQIIDELNRNSDQLDALTKTLSISNPGKIILPITGDSQTASASLGQVVAFSFIGFLVRSDQPTKYYMVPYVLTEGVPVTAFDMVVTANLINNGGQISISIDAEIATTYLASAPTSITFYYFILNQPVVGS